MALSHLSKKQLSTPSSLLIEQADDERTNDNSPPLKLGDSQMRKMQNLNQPHKILTFFRLAFVLGACMCLSILVFQPQKAMATHTNACSNNGGPTVYGAYRAMTIYTPWGGFAGPGNNGQVQIGCNFYGQGDYNYCTRTNGSNDYFALDFQTKSGDALYPYAYGTVYFQGWATGGWRSYGRIVYITHGNNQYSLYTHLSQITVNTGQQVTPGTKIGHSGTSSWNGGPCDNCIGAHLHAAIYQGANFQNNQYGIGPYGGVSVVPESIQSWTFGTVWDNLYLGQTLTY